MVEFRDIQTAAEKIKDFIHKTPLIYSHSFSKMTGTEVYIKAENLQKTGSFKVRGAFNKMVGMKKGKVIAASMGNHAQAVAFAASRLGIEAKIVMPTTAPIIKEEATKSYGAEVICYGENFKEAFDYAMSEKDRTFIHAFDDDKVIAGQGTIGIEIIEDLQNIDTLLIPVGGGGLLSGIAVAVKSLSPKSRIIGVQTESATSAHDSFRQRKICEKPPSSSLADGIAVGRVGDRTFKIIRKYVDDIILVDESAIAMSILLYLERKKLVVEGAGAVPLAVALKNREMFSGKRTVLVTSGGNIDFTVIDRIIQKGLVSSGRVGVFDVIIDDVPGSLHALTGIISSQRGNIINIFHDRLDGNLPIGKTRVKFIMEVRNQEHFEKILQEIRIKRFSLKRRNNII